MTLEELKAEAAAVAQQLAGEETIAAGLRKRFIALRAELIRRGIFDPLLIRFDSATVAQATRSQIAERLETIAANLTV